MRHAQALRGGLWHALLPPGDGTPGEPSLLQQTPPHEWEPALSPTGKLLAYARGEAGESEVMLRGYPDTSGQWQVSKAGGNLPLWNPTGDQLFFHHISGQIFVVDVGTSPEMTLSAPRLIKRSASTLARAGFDIAPDGKRLLMIREVTNDDNRPPSLTIVQNWEVRKDRRSAP